MKILFCIERSVCEQLQNSYSRSSAKDSNDKLSQFDLSMVFVIYELQDTKSYRNSEVKLA